MRKREEMKNSSCYLKKQKKKETIENNSQDSIGMIAKCVAANKIHWRHGFLFFKFFVLKKIK